MASLREKVNVEMENISIVLEELKKTKDKSNKTLVELAGIGTFLHNVYNGVENILKTDIKLARHPNSKLRFVASRFVNTSKRERNYH